MKPSLYVDASAEISIAQRKGLGKVRHLDTTDLWIQENSRNGDINIKKVLGTQTPADLPTKYLSRPDMEVHLAKLQVEKLEGRAASAPKLPAGFA